MGYLGPFCDIQINECLPNPCQNDGVCIDDLSGYVCFCPPNFSGDNCELGPPVCSNSGIPQSTSISNGLIGNYFNFNRLQGVLPTITEAESNYRRVENIDFDWYQGSPLQGVNKDGFSTVWEGALIAPRTGRYTFYFTADDGIRVYIGGSLIVDSWNFQV